MGGWRVEGTLFPLLQLTVIVLAPPTFPAGVTSYWNPIVYTVGLENFTAEKVHEYVFSTIVDSFHKYSRLGGLTKT